MKYPGLVIALFAMLLAIASCSTPAPTYADYSSSMSALPSGGGRIFVYRIDSTGNSVRPTVLLGDEPIGRATPDEFFFVDLPVGNYEISLPSEKDSELPIRVRSGETKYVRLDIHLTPTSWDVNPVLVDAVTGQQELSMTHYAE